jgi:hypothetical protein
MQIDGNNVIVDRNKFNENGQPLPVALNIEKTTTQGHATIRYDLMQLVLSGKEFAAFAVAHELGHKRKFTASMTRTELLFYLTLNPALTTKKSGPPVLTSSNRSQCFSANVVRAKYV